MANSPSSFLETRTRRFGAVTFVVVALLATQVGFRWLGGYLYLMYTYGMARVLHEHLHLISMGKATPWLVSNGDHIPSGGFLWFLVATAITFAVFFALFPFAYRLLPPAKEDSAR